MMAMGKLVGKGRERGFTLIELLIVILIIGILAAVAGPLYIGYTKDAKLGEAKALAGSVWTTHQALAQQNCDVAQVLSNTYSRAGLDAKGVTVPPRWTVGPATATLLSACATGAYTLALGPMTVVGGGTAGTDVTALRVNLAYDAGKSPPTLLTCSTDTGVTFLPC